MPEVLMINPRRRKTRKTGKSVKRAKTRRRNPIAAKSLSNVARRANPMARKSRRARRRNPISGASMGSINSMMMDVAAGTVGAVIVDMAFGAVKSKLPASLQPKANSTVDAYTLLKMGVTLAAGLMLNKSTKGYARKMAVGSLTTQLNDVVQQAIEKTVPSVQLGYGTPNRVVRAMTRVSPGMSGQYSGQNAMLNGRRMNQGVSLRGVPAPSVLAPQQGFSYR